MILDYYMEQTLISYREKKTMAGLIYKKTVFLEYILIMKSSKDRGTVNDERNKTPHYLV